MKRFRNDPSLDNRRDNTYIQEENITLTITLTMRVKGLEKLHKVDKQGIGKKEALMKGKYMLRCKHNKTLVHTPNLLLSILMTIEIQSCEFDYV